MYRNGSKKKQKQKELKKIVVIKSTENVNKIH